MPSAPARPVKREGTAKYRKVLDAIKAPQLRDKLDELAHDERIPSGPLRVWALELLRWRAGDVDRHSDFVLYPVPPSASFTQDEIAIVDRVVCGLIPDFRGARWKALRGDTFVEGGDE